MVLFNSQSLPMRLLLINLEVLVLPILYPMFGQLGQNIIGEMSLFLIIGNLNVLHCIISLMVLSIILQDSAHIGNQIALKSVTKILSLT